MHFCITIENMILKKPEKEVKEIVNPYSWPENYYMETRPEKRKEILEAQTSAEEAEINKLRMELWERRYKKMRKKQYKDDFLGALLDFLIMVPHANSKLGRKTNIKRAKEALDRLCITKVDYYGRDLLLEELKHTVLLYCCTSMEDRSYSTVFFGVGKMKPEKINKKIVAELDNVGRYIPSVLDLKEEMSLLSEAIILAKEHMGF